MKKYILSALLLTTLGCLSAQNEVEISSSLQKVVVYPSEAQLFKQAEASLSSGTLTLKFTKLSSSIVEKSIRVSVGENVTILNVSYEKDYLAIKDASAKIQLYQAKMKGFNEKIDELNVQLKVVADRAEYLSANQTMSQELATPAKYVETTTYFTGLMKENQEKTLQLNRQVAALRDSVNTYNNQIRQLTNTPKEPSGTITVLVNCKQSGQAKFDLSYRVGRSSWVPAYDIRFQGISKPLVLNYKANVSQQSGYDWNDVNLVLSTAETQKTADIPNLKALYLGYVYKEAPVVMEQDEDKSLNDVVVVGYGTAKKRDVVSSVSSEALTGRLAGINVTNAEGSQDADVNLRVRGGGSVTSDNTPLYIVDGYPVSNINDISPSDIKSMDVLKDASSTAIYGSQGANGVILITTKKEDETSVDKEETSLSDYQFNPNADRKPTTVTFEIPEAQTVKSEKKNTLIPFKQTEVPCIFEYKAIPKLAEKVYLMARIPSWVDYDLQSGAANLYFENAFIGKTRINTRSLNDTLSVSFGPDQGISIKREKYKDFTQKTGLVTKQLQTLSWRIVLKNNKNEAVKVDVYDQVPLSNSDDTSIKPLEISGGELNETTGQLHWPVSLASGASKEIILTIEVKYPKGKRLILK